MLKTKQLLTYKDYAMLPDDNRYELLNGELFMVPSPGFFHQSISRDIEFLLWNFVKSNSLGMVFDAPFDVVLTDNNVVQPDIIFVSNENRAIVTEKNIQGAPDLVVEILEILSSGTRERDVLFKKTLYATSGIREYWIVDPTEKNIEVLTLCQGTYETHGTYFPEDNLDTPMLLGFNPSLNEIFSV